MLEDLISSNRRPWATIAVLLSLTLLPGLTAAGQEMARSGSNTPPAPTSSFMLKNPVYCGLIVHNKQVYKGNFTALVSEELWHNVQDTLRGKRKAVPKKTVDDSFPLRGFVKCGYCRAKLTAGNAKAEARPTRAIGVGTNSAASLSAWTDKR